MATAPASGPPQAGTPSLWRAVRAHRGMNLFLGLLLLCFLLGPWIIPFSPTDIEPERILLPPGFPFVFGTDEFGRDVFSRIVAGTQPTLLPAFASAALGVLLGTATGLFAGYHGGRLDDAVMRLMDVLMSFPALILAMLIVVMTGPSMINVVLAIGVVFWPRSARLVRSAVLDLARREFIDACRARGESVFYILRHELLPNTWAIIAVDFSLRASYGILLSASLSYLGIGVKAPTPAWGLMVKDAQQFIQIAPWLVIFPCLAISVVSIGAVMFGERLRRAVSVAGERGSR